MIVISVSVFAVSVSWWFNSLLKKRLDQYIKWGEKMSSVGENKGFVTIYTT